MFPLFHLWGNEELWDDLSSRDMSHAPGENKVGGAEFDEHGLIVFPRNEPCGYPRNSDKTPKLLTCKNKEDGTRELEKKDKIITVEILKEQLVNAKDQINAT